MASPPKVRIFVLCDAAVEDPMTGKVTLVGIFGGVTASEYPTERPACAVYLQLTGLRGEYAFRVQVLAPDLLTIVADGSLADPFTVFDPLASVQLAGTMQSFELPVPGVYTVRLMYNALIAEEFPLPVGDAR